MSPAVLTIIGLALIFVCTALGSAFVYVFKGKEISANINQIFLGFAAGIMLSASIFSLIIPAINGSTETSIPSWIIVGLSVLLGAAFIWGIDKLVPHLHSNNQEEGLKTQKINKTSKMFLAVTIHNVPEGLAVGIAYGIGLASITTSNNVLLGALMLAIGIGIQNIPEGAVVSLLFKGDGRSNNQAFAFGALSGAVEPVAGLIGLALAFSIQAIMPWALAFAAGCMLYVIAEEMIPDIKSNSINHRGVWAFMIGFILMMILDVALG